MPPVDVKQFDVFLSYNRRDRELVRSARAATQGGVASSLVRSVGTHAGPGMARRNRGGSVQEQGICGLRGQFRP
jgi:hypothetical protein